MRKMGLKITSIILFSLLAIFCICYGLLIRNLQSGTRFFVIWFLGALFFLILLFLTASGLFAKFPKPVKISFVSLILLGLTCFLVFLGIILRHFKDEGRDNLDYIIVLGAQVHENAPSNVLRHRLDKAYEYLVANPNTICIVSGGKGDNELLPEANIMRDYLVEKGISNSRILLEDQSKNTVENMQLSKKLIPPQSSVGIITNNFHLFRALYIGEKEGIENPVGIAAKSTKIYLLNNILREFMAMVKYLLKFSI